MRFKLSAMKPMSACPMSRVREGVGDFISRLRNERRGSYAQRPWTSIRPFDRSNGSGTGNDLASSGRRYLQATRGWDLRRSVKCTAMATISANPGQDSRFNSKHKSFESLSNLMRRASR